MMDDPFGDPFGEGPAPVVKPVPVKKPITASKPATSATTPASPPKPTPQPPAPAPALPKQASVTSKPAASSSALFAEDDDPFASYNASSSSATKTHTTHSAAPVVTDEPTPQVTAKVTPAPVIKQREPEPVTEPEPVATKEEEEQEADVEEENDEPNTHDDEENGKGEEVEDESVKVETKKVSQTAQKPSFDDETDENDALTSKTSLKSADEPSIFDAPAASVAISSAASPSSSASSSYVELDDEDSPDSYSLEDTSITELPSDLIRQRGLTLLRLDLTQNKFTSLDSLKWPYSAPAWPKLNELILDKNQLESLKGSPTIPSLTTLWLNNNKITDLELVLDQIEKLFPHLTYLSMLRNPCTPDMYFSQEGSSEMEMYTRYRLYVIYRLKSLQFLDATEVTTEERKEATLRGAYCRVAKPQSIKSSSNTASNGGSTKLPSSDSSTSMPSPSTASPRSTSSQVGVSKDANAKPPKVATFLAKGKPRYDGTNSEGNRFIMNDDL